MHINPYPTMRPVPAKRARNGGPNQPQGSADFADEVEASLQDQRRRQAKKQNKAMPPETETKPGKSGIIDTSA